MTYSRQYYAATVLLVWSAILSLGVNYLDVEYSGHTPEVLEIDMEPLSAGSVLPPLKLHAKKPPPKEEPLPEIGTLSPEVIFISDREKNCLIRNVFYESRGEPY